MRIVILILACLTLAIPAAASSLIPVINNPGFEEVAPGNDAPGWGWYIHGGARTGFRSETQNPHSGSRCLVFANESNLAPEVYGRLHHGIGVLPGTEYELSAWVRGEDIASGIHFTDWSSYMLNIPEGTYDWRKVSMTFRTRNDQHGLNLGMNIVNRCKVLAIDDITLRPIGSPLKGNGIDGSFILPSQVVGDNKPANLAISAKSSLSNPVTVKAVIMAGKEVLFKKDAVINQGENDIEFEWNSGSVVARRLNCSIQVLDDNNKVIASASRDIQKVSPTVVSADLDRIEARMDGFNALYAKCLIKGIPLDYPTSTRTMLNQFIPLTREDIKRGELMRANHAITDLNRSINWAVEEMTAYLKNPKTAPIAKRYQTSKADIKGVSFIADRKDTKGNTSRGPVFFCGHGHFFQVREDMPKWPGYGVNIIQIEVGPRITMPTEDKIDLKAAQEIVEVLDNAAKHNVKVNILLSPHYFPEWAMAKWPHLAKAGGGFLGFCVDAPEAKLVIEKFLRTVVPMFKDKPALHSFCLSNEPLFNNTAGADNTKPMWIEYLAKVHGNVQTMNTRYGTQYSSFEEVPIPGNDSYDAPQFYDYCIFNQERFAGWHQWMGDIIHEMAPSVPVHAKVMAWTFFMRNAASWGTDVEMFGQFSQNNGNDCSMYPAQGGEWAISWHGQNMAYDLQRSMVRQPIFNSENHLTTDGSTYYVPPQHFRTALWQGAIHGQGATTIWVWERTTDPSDPNYAGTVPFYGNVMDRPGCAEAVGRTCLDLNRFAEEVTALETKPAHVAILYSMSSITRSPRYLDAMGSIYTALNFCGVKIDFISEKQLAAGKGKDYKLIVLPNATHMPDAAFQALVGLPSTTQFIVLGDTPQKNPYGQAFPDDEVSKITAKALVFAGDTTAEQMWPKLQIALGYVGGIPDFMVVDAVTGDPAWGVEWLPAQVGSRTVMNLVNLTEKPVDVQILLKGNPVNAVNLLSLGGKSEVKTLLPITPVLAEVEH